MVQWLAAAARASTVIRQNGRQTVDFVQVGQLQNYRKSPYIITYIKKAEQKWAPKLFKRWEVLGINKQQFELLPVTIFLHIHFL